MKFTKKQKEVFFKKGHVPANKRIFTSEEEEYIKDNYAKVTKVEMGAKLKLNPHTILRIMNRMGLKRTKADIEFVRSQKRKRDPNWTMTVRKIEGGGRGKTTANYHLNKWSITNGTFSDKKVLVYKNEIGNFDDLILISKLKYNEHIRKREVRKLLAEKYAEKKNRKEEKQKKIQSKAIVNAVVRNNTIKRKLEKEAMEKKFEAIKASRPKSPEEAHLQLVEEGRVPVKLDHKTTVWVNKSKCELINGEWVKKTPLNIVTQKEQEQRDLFKIKTIKHGKAKEDINLDKTDGESHKHIFGTNDATSN